MKTNCKRITNSFQLIILFTTLLLVGCSSIPVERIEAMPMPTVPGSNTSATRPCVHRTDQNVTIMWDNAKGHGFTYGPEGKQMTAHSPGRRADCRKCREGVPR